MNRNPAAASLPLLLALAALSPAEDADRAGPLAFVPLESPAVAAQLREAGALAVAKRIPEAVATLQEVIDGALWDRVVPLDGDRDTLEQARERAHRILAKDPALREAHRRRFGEAADGLLASALRYGDLRGLREVFARFPLTGAGARAGLLLAREAHRRGLPEEALGILDRMEDFGFGDGPPAPPPPELLSLRAASAAAAGESDPARGPAGPRGPLALLWRWPGDPEELAPAAGDLEAYGRGDLPLPANHLVAVQDGVVYWTDPFTVTAIDLATGRTLARSAPPPGAGHPAAGGDEVRGETFAPSADGHGVLASLAVPDPRRWGRRTGTLCLLEPRGLRLLARRGGDPDVEHPELAGRFVFHGRPLLLGDRVFTAATEAADFGGNAVGDVRTHVLAFRRGDLGLLWDTFVAYGSGIRSSDVSPAGTLVHRHGRLYLATHTGLEACLDARTGGLLWAHRYRTPELAPTARLSTQVDRTMTPVLWNESPPVFSGGLVAFAPRDSYYIDFLFQRPLPATGAIRADHAFSRPRRDNGDLTALWVLPGPAGKFFLAGQAAGSEEAPLLLRDLDPAAARQVPWRGPVMEFTVAGLPVRTADAVYLATEKAIYRVPYPGRDGEIETLAVIPPFDPEKPRPSAGNLVVLPDRILSVADDGILCFGPASR